MFATALALVVVAGLAVLPAADASGMPGARARTGDSEVAEARAALADASAARAAAESRLADARARQAAVTAEIDKLSDGAATITAELAQARADVREYAVAAYIDGGQGALAAAGLDPSQRAEVAWHTQLVGSTTADAAEAIDRFNKLKEANEPARVAAAARLDAINEEVTNSFNDAVQAGAHERDAEALLAQVTAAAQASAAARASRDAAARAATQAPVADTSGVSQTTASSAASAASVAPSPQAPASSVNSGAGSPTASEAATLARIRGCESRGNYGIVSASGLYRGAYQFDRRTWAGVGGSGDPAAASPAEQDYRALLLLRQRGTRPWPNCG